MPRAHTEERLVEYCKACKNACTRKNRCEIFTEPAYQWRKGPCWGRTGSKVVYLGGSIDAHDTMEAANNWRKQAAQVLTEAGFLVLSPLRWDNPYKRSSREIVETCLADVRVSDIMLVEMTHPDIGYIGTAMEMRYGWERKKEIILWGEANQQSHWLRIHGTKRYKTLEHALNALVGI